jgi:predicted signal transduction protein with EAL and GGDEF domain
MFHHAAPEAERSRPQDPSMAREQFKALTGLIPVLYGVVIVVTLILVSAFHKSAPNALAVICTLILLSVVATRLVYWVQVRSRNEAIPQAELEQQMKLVGVIGPFLSLSFSVIGLMLLQYGDLAQQALAIISI